MIAIKARVYDVLQEGREKAQVMKELILQPQSEIAQLRGFFRSEGYEIVKEDMVYEDGKYYPVIKAIPGKMKENISVFEQEVYDLFGPYLLEQKHPVLKQYLIYSCGMMEGLRNRLETQKSERALARLPEVNAELAHIYSALKWYE